MPIISSGRSLFSFESDGPDPHLYRYLDTNGNGTGTKNATGNYSGGATDFYIQPPAGKVFLIESILFFIEDTGTLDSGGYGAATALTNGLLVRVTSSADVVETDLLDGVPIKSNGDFGAHMWNLEPFSFGTGNDFIHARWNFEESSGSPIYLHDQEKLKVTLEDNFSGLVSHRFMVQGIIGNFRDRLSSGWRI
jgi:hypothetical protein